MLLAVPALRGEDKPSDKDKPITAKEQYAALMKAHQEAMQTASKAMREAKSPDEQQKAMKEMRGQAEKFAPRFLELAQKNPKDPVALDALVFIVSNSRSTGGKSSAHEQAMALLLKDHVSSEKIGRICQSLGFSYDDTNDKFLRAVMEKNPNGEAQAEACLALAQSLRQRASIAKRIKDDAELAGRVASALSKEIVDYLQKTDVAKLEAEGDEAYRVFADKHVAALKADRLMTLCQQLSFSGGAGGETLLRAVLEKDKRQDVQGVACVSLAAALKQRADDTMDKDAKEGAKLRAQAEELFQRAMDKYADVKTPFRGTVGERAKSELYEIRHLAVGMKAPEVEGIDQDGKKFKLADYKGKVVLLDFWSEF